MTDYAPASILALAEQASKNTTDVITIIMSQNGGGGQRYAAFEPLGDDVVEALSEEDVAFARFPDRGELTKTLESLSSTIEEGSPVSAEIISFQDGEVIDTTEFNMG